MEWLVCNKCYKLMETTTERNFFMTQCGHIFCELCISKAPTKCFVCEMLDFRSLQLTRPPKLETKMNYFSSAKDFAQQMKKAMEFHDEQFAISQRGYEELEKKYQNGKRSYAEIMKEIEEINLYYAKMRESRKELDAARRAYKQQKMERREVSTNMEMEICEESQNRPRFGDQREHQPGSSHSRNLSTRHVDMPADAARSQEQRRMIVGSSTMAGNWKTSLQPIPEYPYNPSPAFSNESCTSAASISASDSGCETMSMRTPATIREGDFIVPTTQRVPKSVASLRRKARTLPRLSTLLNDR